MKRRSRRSTQRAPDVTAVDRYWGEPYLQHNPIAASGVTAFRNIFSGLISPGNSVYALSRIVGECDLVHHTIGDGNFVFVLSEGAVGATDVAHYDLFRLEDSLIVEHWNGRRNVPASTQSGLGIF